MNNICKCPFKYCEDISSIHFINTNQISFNCLRSHNIKEQITNILNLNNDKIKKEINISYDTCKKHNIKFSFFCNTCNINFCYYCRENHSKHKYISIKEKIPSSNIYNNLNTYIKEQKNELEKIKNLFNESIEKMKEDFNKIYYSLYNYLLCEEYILLFSINNINHLNSIENINA